MTYGKIRNKSRTVHAEAALGKVVGTEKGQRGALQVSADLNLRQFSCEERSPSDISGHKLWKKEISLKWK